VSNDRRDEERSDMPFIQIIECETSKIDQLERLNREWEQSTDGKATARRVVLCQDRDRPEHVYEMVFFDSYESAMENSELQETQDFANRMRGVLDGEPRFHDLDILEDRTLR
jgi:hypothetical protein